MSFLSNKANAEAIEFSGGLFGELWNDAFGNHVDRVEDAREILGKIAAILEASSKELANSSRYYQTADHGEAAKLDSTYPQSKRRTPEGTEWDMPEERGDFKDIEDARSELKIMDGDPGAFDVVGKVKDYGGGHADEFSFNPAFKVMGTGMDLISPSALVTEGLKLAFDFDPFSQVGAMVGGNWEGYLKYSEVWANLNKFCTAVAANVSSGNYSIRYSWEGNAADAAQVYFEELCTLLTAAAETFESFRANYEMIAHSVFALTDTVKSLLMFLSDLALEAIIIWAASTSMATTGVGFLGTLAGYALVAKRILDMVDQYKILIKAIDVTIFTARGLYGAAAASGANTSSNVKKFPTPGSGYDNAVVGN
ncbi:hypothetical protein [Streptomyces sp. NPDC002994]|uniref:hypothetical protein n=1 Tax=Streptomyces sp. NPDC002994 TaxID=3154441 RepID=UPI0033AB5F7C